MPETPGLTENKLNYCLPILDLRSLSTTLLGFPATKNITCQTTPGLTENKLNYFLPSLDFQSPTFAILANEDEYLKPEKPGLTDDELKY